MGSSSCLNVAIAQPCVSLFPSLSPHSKLPNPNSPNPNQFLLSHSSFTPITTSCLALRSNQTLSHPRSKKFPSPNAPNFYLFMDFVLLRAEVAAASENGKLAKEYMEKGELVPDEIVVMMVKERLLQPDSQEKGWLLDGYPRSSSQAAALEDYVIRPDLFILLDVPEGILVERVVGRRLDPLTGKIYHLKYSPPEDKEIASRLTKRLDDTAEKVKLSLRTHHQNVEAVLSIIKISHSREIIWLKKENKGSIGLVTSNGKFQVNGNAAKENVFAQIDAALM